MQFSIDFHPCCNGAVLFVTRNSLLGKTNALLRPLNFLVFRQSDNCSCFDCNRQGCCPCGESSVIPQAWVPFIYFRISINASIRLAGLMQSRQRDIFKRQFFYGLGGSSSWRG